MAAGPQRRPVPVPHLMAHIRPVELALQERARVLEDRAIELEKSGPADEIGTSRLLAAEFRALAAELHHWG